MFKKWLKLEISIVLLALIFTVVESCKEKGAEQEKAIALNAGEESATSSKRNLSQEFKDYWYAGNAEISSYKLEQARYGELREGTTVLIYVTEPFLPGLQVKADDSDPSNIPVLKLNSTKSYLTGIYPYSIMTSSFYPVYDGKHALKVSFSSQEWCGQVYAQLNNRTDFDITSHSYFATEGDQNIKLTKMPLEDEIWNKIRIAPTDLRTGEMEMIPSFEYIRLTHKELKGYNATATLTSENEMSTYTITYPELERTLKINFTSDFPHTIESWTDSYKGGYGQNAKVLTSTATKINSLKTPYWQQNQNKDLYLRDSLGL
jgi:hypothetical protein